jgi:hypothetical protein
MNEELPPLWDNNQIILMATDVVETLPHTKWGREAAVVDAMRLVRSDYLAHLQAAQATIARLTQANAELAAEVERLKAQLAEAESQNWSKQMMAIVDEINADVRNLRADK